MPGFTVYAGARRLEAMDDLLALGIKTIRLDVTSDSSVKEAFDLISNETNGQLDFLFNNAGTSCTFPAIDLEISDAEDCFQVNLFGVMRMTKVFLPLLINSKGSIINTGSVAGKINFPFASVYAASKAALHQYSDVLRIELKPFDVKVITLVVGAVLTDIADTRPLPQDSLYLDIEDGVQMRRSMAKDSKPMTPDTFAQHIVAQVVKKNPNPIIWYGQWYFLLWLASLTPRFLLDFILSKRFLLNKLAEVVKTRKKQA